MTVMRRCSGFCSFPERFMRVGRKVSSQSLVMGPAHGTTTHSLLGHRARRHRLDVAIVGLPNAGKSQLLNKLTQSPVSAVSRKRHTTRRGVLGARTVDDVQLMFVDTPGFLKLDQARREGLQQMVSAAMAEASNVDHTLLVVDAARALTGEVRETLAVLMQQALQARGRVEVNDDDEGSEEGEGHEEPSELRVHGNAEDEPAETAEHAQKLSIVLNKVDLVYPKSDLLEVASELSDIAEGLMAAQADREVPPLTRDELDGALPTFFYVSARDGDGVDDILRFLLDRASVCRSWEIEPDQSTSLTDEERVEEIVREKIYRCLHREVPYHIAQRNVLFQVRRDATTGRPGLLIHQEIIVRTKSHQELVFGAGSRTLERIRETAQRDLESVFRCRVVLQLQVKLLNKSRQRNNWSI